MLSKENLKDIYPMTPMQKAMLFHALSEAESMAYFMQFSLRISDALDVGLYEQSWNALLKRHEILRSVFVYRNVPEPLQIVLKDRSIEFFYEDLRQKGIETDAHRKNYLDEYKERDRRRGFNLSKDVLIRVAVLQWDEQCFDVVMSFHHILMDGWSLEIVIREITAVYMNLKSGKNPDLPTVPDYRQFIEWITSRNKVQAQAYWKTYLDGYQETTRLFPKQRTADLTSRYLPQKHIFTIDTDTAGKLHRLAAKEQATINTMIHALWGILIARYNYSDDVVFEAVVSGRPEAIDGVDRMVGLFINTIPVRIKLKGETTIKELIRITQQNAVASNEYDDYALADIQADNVRKRFSDHIVAFENYPFNPEKDPSVSTNEPSTIESVDSFQYTDYDFEIVIMPSTEIVFEIRWNGNICHHDHIRRLEGHFRMLIEQLIHNPDMKIQHLDMISVPEKDRVLKVFNDTQRQYPRDDTVVSLFEKQVEKTPDASAIRFGQSHLTYRKLNEKANRLAHYIRQQHRIQPDDFVAVMLDRSEWMFIAIVGILKAGGAFLPIDRENPESRIQLMMADTRARVIITTESKINGLDLPVNITPLFIETLDKTVAGQPSHNPQRVNMANDLIYVMYTSGSTGIPKGVLIEHRSVIRLVKNTNFTNVQPGDRIAQLSTYAFDASTFEIWGAFLNGGTLCLLEEDAVADPEKIKAFIGTHRIDAMWLTAGLFNRLSDADISIFQGVKTLLTGGEKLSAPHINRIKREYPALTVINGYGPTENTTFTACHRIENFYENDIPVGVPIANTHVLILDACDRLAPVSIPGEICTGGDGLARGYLNDRELTDKKFITHPFFPGERLYRTGDMGCWTDEGLIEYIGRKDDQYKIRGFRVEKGEIENTFLKHPDIRQAYVSSRPSKDDTGIELIAYMVASVSLNVSELRTWMSRMLPEYMIPTFFVQLEALPLNPNGKVDKRALPDPEHKGIAVGTEYVAPENDVEIRLTEIWKSILQRDPIGVNDNFFDLGGHSLKATQMVSRIYREFSVEIGLKDIFQSGSIRQIAGIIQGKSLVSCPMGKAPDQPFHELSHAQKRLWFACRTDEHSIVYNIRVVLALKGKLNIGALKNAFDAMILRHESLRTVFVEVDGKPMQKILPQMPFEIEDIDLSDASDPQELFEGYEKKAATEPFDLVRGPLLRAQLFTMAHQRRKMLLTMHHIISDGWSLDIFIKELVTFYQSADRNLPPALPSMAIQYKDFAWRQNRILKDAQQLKTFWHQMLADLPAPLELPIDYARTEKRSYQAGTVSIDIDTVLTQGITRLQKQADASLYMVVMTLVTALLYRYSAQEDMVMGTVMAGRTHPDLENQIGFYVNTLPVRIKPQRNQPFLNLLKETKRIVTQVFDHQDYPFDMMVSDLDLGKDRSRFPVFDVLVSLQSTIKMARIDLGALEISVIEDQSIVSEFDLAFYFIERDATIVLCVEYLTGLFRHDTIVKMTHRLIKLIQAVVENPDIEISEIPLTENIVSRQDSPVSTQFNF